MGLACNICDISLDHKVIIHGTIVGALGYYEWHLHLKGSVIGSENVIQLSTSYVARFPIP